MEIMEGFIPLLTLLYAFIIHVLNYNKRAKAENGE